jgi:cytochrome o ubiquinol oxidase subunit IV
MERRPEPEYATYKSYTVGFISCVLLTLAAYFAVDQRLLSGMALIGTIFGLGLVQAGVQLLLFLHLDKEEGPRWNFFMFFCMISILFVIVVGTLWIMANLRYNVMKM